MFSWGGRGTIGVVSKISRVCIGDTTRTLWVSLPAGEWTCREPGGAAVDGLDDPPTGSTTTGIAGTTTVSVTIAEDGSTALVGVPWAPGLVTATRASPLGVSDLANLGPSAAPFALDCPVTTNGAMLPVGTTLGGGGLLGLAGTRSVRTGCPEAASCGCTL